jgi:signal transduction histidine kinase
MTASRFSLRGSVAARLALGYGILAAGSIAAVALLFYMGTVGVLERSIDTKITSISDHMVGTFRREGASALARAIRALLSDRVDSDTEIVLLLSADGQPLSGNMPGWTGPLPPFGCAVRANMLRDGQPVAVRVITRQLGDGSVLLIGRDLRELTALRVVIVRALLASFAISLLIVFGGALLFRRQIEWRISQIRLTTGQIEAGDLSRRIPVVGEDEFALLSRDINRMLDRIEHLMEGVRHVSNSIAHDLRTPLTRVRSRLDHALQSGARADALSDGARRAIEDIDGLIIVFEKLLQIAAAESGVRPTSFVRLDLFAIAVDIVDLYEAAAEERGVRLMVSGTGPVYANGDRDLLGNALASLVDNAIKYAGPGVSVEVSACTEAGAVSMAVRDNGPGVPTEELGRIAERFYRVDRGRHLPGNGLGLSIVGAIAQLHAGTLALSNLAPGLEARIVLPPFALVASAGLGVAAL